MGIDPLITGTALPPIFNWLLLVFTYLCSDGFAGSVVEDVHGEPRNRPQFQWDYPMFSHQNFRCSVAMSIYQRVSGLLF